LFENALAYYFAGVVAVNLKALELVSDWANFCLLSSCFHCEVYENYSWRSKFWATFYPRIKLCVNFDKNGLG
jgi:hypothetical protein